jgi:hypothetical protein
MEKPDFVAILKQAIKHPTGKKTARCRCADYSVEKLKLVLFNDQDTF